ncbi:MAG: hypothetical protein K2H56_02005 [Malacoplasma sp.]|nr:hypothetical protein [Malacoplasma sp.]MDE7099703.1 hypothetical protein [Malacoplasma sp.]
MKKLKWLKGLVLSSFVGLTAVSLVACGTTNSGGGATHSFTSSPTNYIDNNNSPLNASFNNSPISTYAQSVLYGLTAYQTTGQFVLDGQTGNFKETTNDTLILEGASAVIVFKSEDVMKDVDNKLDSNLLTENGISQKEILSKLNDIKTSVDKSTSSQEGGTTQETKADGDSSSTKWQEGTDYWVFTRDKGGIQYQKGIDQDPDANVSQYYNDAMSYGKTYQFVIDTDNWWVDSNGASKQRLSSKDFERGLEAYTLGARIGYNRNSYFLDLIGLSNESLGKTVGYKNNDGSYVLPEDPNYDISNFANKNDAVYTMYIDEEYPYALDLISKEYFGALPNTNEKVKNISLKSKKISVTNGKINDNATSWNDIFGSGGLQKFTENTWYAGAYYISAFTSTQIIFNLNHAYMDTVGRNLLSYVDGKVLGTNNQNTDSRMEQVVINYGSGTADTYFENFKVGQIDYLSSVPEAKRSEANSLRGSIVPIKVVQTTQSNYIAYTPNPYIVNEKGEVEENENLKGMAQFIYEWDSKEATTIRAGIAGLVNYYQLASFVYSSKDFQLSATPYGAFKDYYESISNNKTYGALPRPYSDYTATKNNELGEFKIPYYSYDSNASKINIEELTINKTSFQNAVNHYSNNNESKKLNFAIKFGEGSWSTNYTNFLLDLEKTIEGLSPNIDVVLLNRDAQTPTSTQWFNNQSSPLGFSYWSPDYNGVGTWIEADNTIQSTTITKTDSSGKETKTKYEGVPGTNAHNSFHTFLTSMVYAVKLMNYTWNSTTNKYEADNSNSNSGDPYASDVKIQKAFSNDTLQSLGINQDDSSFDKKITPGERYGTVAIELLNLLIEKGVFDQSALTKYINDPTQLKYPNNAPKDPQSLWLGGDVIKASSKDGVDQSANFSKYLGIFAGQSVAKALWANTVLDSDYSFIPRPEAGLKEQIITLVNPDYVARSGTQSVNWRDFGIKNK